MKVDFVGINSKYIHSNLAIRYLKGYTEDLKYESNIMEFSINDRIERIVEEIVRSNPDLVCFSCYIWNIEYVIKICNILKNINKDMEILCGGPEVSFNPKEIFEKASIDYIIKGEGEETFREFMLNKITEGIKNKEKLSTIEGLYSKVKDEIIFGGNRCIMDMNKIKFPYKEDENLDNKIVYYEASRGCPYGCKYCLSSVDRKVRFLNIDRVKKELKFFMDKKVELVKFVDRTFNCNPKFAIEIWDYIINSNTETKFHFEISADVLNEEQIKVLRKCPTGRIQFEVGVQTTNDEILKNINRNVKFKDIKNKILNVKQINTINQHLDLIAGLPGEDLNSFINSFNEVYLIEPEEVQLGFLKILKGSPMMQESDLWGMKYSPYPPYEILKTKDISYKELLELKMVEQVLDKYYNSGKFNNIINYFLPMYKTPYEFYKKLSLFCYKKGYFSRNISSVQYYKIFLEFNTEVLNENNGILKDIIKYDYLKYNKKNWIPNFLQGTYDNNKIKNIKRSIKEISKEQYKSINIEEYSINILKFEENKEIVKENICLAYCYSKNGDERIINVTHEI